MDYALKQILNTMCPAAKHAEIHHIQYVYDVQMLVHTYYMCDQASHRMWLSFFISWINHFICMLLCIHRVDGGEREIESNRYCSHTHAKIFITFSYMPFALGATQPNQLTDEFEDGSSAKSNRTQNHKIYQNYFSVCLAQLITYSH